MEPLFDKLSRKMTERHIPPSRFFASMIFAISLVLFSVLLFLFNIDAADSDLPPYQPNTALENVALVSSDAIMLIVGWPFAVAALIGGDRLFAAAFFPLLILTGLFWAFLVEWIFARKRHSRSKPKQNAN